jgi:hypothetical protein
MSDFPIFFGRYPIEFLYEESSEQSIAVIPKYEGSAHSPDNKG